jgi:hypothetical protein
MNDLDKLPKWAQDEIKRLKISNDQLLEEVVKLRKKDKSTEAGKLFGLLVRVFTSEIDNLLHDVNQSIISTLKTNGEIV